MTKCPFEPSHHPYSRLPSVLIRAHGYASPYLDCCKHLLPISTPQLSRTTICFILVLCPSSHLLFPFRLKHLTRSFIHLSPLISHQQLLSPILRLKLILHIICQPFPPSPEHPQPVVCLPRLVTDHPSPQLFLRPLIPTLKVHRLQQNLTHPFHHSLIPCPPIWPSRAQHSHLTLWMLIQ